MSEGGTDKDCPGCELCAHRLAGKSLFSQLSEHGLTVLENSRHSRTFSAGRTLFREGDSPSGLWCLSRGLVKLFRNDAEGRIHFLRWARPGEPIGYRALFSPHPHKTTAEALTDCEICHISADVFRALLKREPSLGPALTKKLSDDLDSAEQGWFRACGLNSQQRVAALLLDWDRIPHKSLSRKDLAEVVGLTPETLSRVLTHFHKQKIVKRQPRRLTVLDKDALREMLHDR